MFLLPFKAKWREGDKVWGWCIQMKVHFFYFQLSPVVSIDDRALLFLTRSFSLLRDASCVSHTILWQQQGSEDAENPTSPWPRVSVLDHGLSLVLLWPWCWSPCHVWLLLWDQLIIPFHWAAGAPCYITNLSGGPATTWTLFSPCTRSFLAYDEFFASCWGFSGVAPNLCPTQVLLALGLFGAGLPPLQQVCVKPSPYRSQTWGH